VRPKLHELGGAARELGWALKRRGLRWAAGNEERDLVFAGAGLDAAETAALYRKMHSYAFRLFLRDVIRHRAGFTLSELERYVSAGVAERYLAELTAWRIAETEGEGRWHLCSRMARSFGETLEWYVAQLLERAFGCPAAWGVRATQGDNGGDYDVLALVEGRLLYVEVKSSPPKHISVETVRNFLRRIEDLGPELSIFLEDTHLRLEDKVVPLFLEALGPGVGPETVIQERRHLFAVRPPGHRGRGLPRLFVTSSRPSLEANLAYCLRRLLVPGYPVPASVARSAEVDEPDPTLPPEPPPAVPVQKQ
jgi:hypothetical protein